MKNPLTLIQGRIDADSIKQLSEALINEVEAGITDPIEMLAKIEFMKKVCEKIRAGIQDTVIDEIYNHPGKKADMGGMMIELRASAGRTDYSNTERWNELKAKEAEITEERKALEKLLAGVTEPMETVDSESGELIQLNPPIKEPGKDTIFVIPKK